MLTISHLNAWFPDPSAAPGSETDLQVLNDVSLSIKPGQTVALVGESGSGKSVTALSILRLLEENTPIRTEGSIIFENKELLELPLPHLRTIRGNRIAMIFQEPMTSLNPVFTIGNQLAEPLRKHQEMTRLQADKEAIRLLERTGIVDPEKRLGSYPHQLSGGQRQRVMIAMALACRPHLLIADEPTTALDVSIQAQILELIRGIQQEYDMAMLLITHDLNVVRSVGDYLYIMHDGKILEHGSTKKIFTAPSHPYTRQLLSSLPQTKQTITAPDAAASPLLSTDNLTCTFQLKKGLFSHFQKNKHQVHAVKGVDLAIYQGTTCGIIGESGSGKTTLALALLKLVNSTGSILFDNMDLQNMTAAKLRQQRHRFQIVFQDPFSSLSPRLSIGEIVEEGLKVHRRDLGRQDRRKLVIRALSEVGLEPGIISRYPHEFSGGQRQRIAIARVIILNPDLLILDEPTSALDMTIQIQILELLQDLQRKSNLTYLFISHDLRVIRAISDQIIVMRHGTIIEAGSTDQVFANPRDSYTRDLFNAALSIPSATPISDSGYIRQGDKSKGV